MAIHSTGAISFQDLINEFNVPKPVSLSQMYAGGGYVPEANTGVPKNGAISLGNFYGATAAIVLDYNVTADVFNLSTNAIMANSGWDGITPVILTINVAPGIVVSGNNTATPAMAINTFPAGSQVFINNNGYIIGMGGAGGGGGADGGAGGTALATSSPTTVNNIGTIGAGGGGGGGTFNIGGGGGRSGRQPSGGGYGNGGSGDSGTFNSAGNGRSATSQWKGGNGGSWGAVGGNAIGLGARTGGAGGAAVIGNSLINWTSNGDIYGNIID